MSPQGVTNPRLGDDELLFSRDLDGRLIRLDKATADQLDDEVTIVIDDRAIRVARAIPSVDSQGRPLLDDVGRVIPRATTIFDAAEFLTDAVAIVEPDGTTRNDETGRVIHRRRLPQDPRPARDELTENPIPILCHQPHLDPVGVCRACVVEISRIKRQKRRTERKLLPACQHRVEDAMEVRTIATSPRVKTTVNMVVELLAADHPSPCLKEQTSPGTCELEALANRLEVGVPRFAVRPARTLDKSSLLIAVDHSACILCDRCVRSCNDVMDNQVIGRMLKGYEARISFDLNALMGQSSCVSCGECMVSCPTGALTFKGSVGNDTFDGLDPPAEPVSTHQLFEHLDPEIRRAFSRVSPAFLEFNAGAVVRRRFRPGDIVCRQGEFGATAFFIEDGQAEIYIQGSLKEQPKDDASGVFGFLKRTIGALRPTPQTEGRDFYLPDASITLSKENPTAILEKGEIVGEMSCLNGYPRSATVRAGLNGCTVLEMRRNVLDILRRSRSFRERMDRLVRERVINIVLKSVPLCSTLNSSQIKDLSKKAKYRRFDPKEVIIRQDDLAIDPTNPLADGMFLVRSGFVRVEKRQADKSVDLNYLGPGSYFGEIALLSGFSPTELGLSETELGIDLNEIRKLSEPGRRTATCSALDHVEIVQLTAEDFREVLKTAEPKVKRSVISSALARLESNLLAARAQPKSFDLPQIDVENRSPLLGEFLNQGLMGAQSVLVLDLEKCTRCDECSKACSDTHGNVTRLIREGLRFDKYLVASSCRSCHDPVCLVGCPVDAIHRGPGSIEIQIQDSRCIGCGRCAENCPYGNINMHQLDELMLSVSSEHQPPMRVARKATTCDQCHSLPGHQPNCVAACPHDAAHRMEGPKLYQLVQAATDFRVNSVVS